MKSMNLTWSADSKISSLRAVQARPPDDYCSVQNCQNGRSPKETWWWFHDDKVTKEAVTLGVETAST
jgi:hypothetical protein